MNMHAIQSVRPKHWFCIVDEIDASNQKMILISDIQKTVARYYSLTTHDLFSDCRTNPEVLARHVAMYLCREMTRRSHEFIAHAFHRCDHSVSLWAHRKISGLIKTDARLVAEIAALKTALEE